MPPLCILVLIQASSVKSAFAFYASALYTRSDSSLFCKISFCILCLRFVYSTRADLCDIGLSPMLRFTQRSRSNLRSQETARSHRKVSLHTTLAEQSASVHLQASLQMNLTLNITSIIISIIPNVISSVNNYYVLLCKLFCKTTAEGKKRKEIYLFFLNS